MPLFMDHSRRDYILADPLKITNHFSWLLVLMIASIRAMNGDIGLSILISPLMMHEATAAFSPEQLSQGTGDPQGAQ